MKKRVWIVWILLMMLIIIGAGWRMFYGNQHETSTEVLEETPKITVSKISNKINGTWQAKVKFPDWKGYVDDTLAMNSMYSFDGFRGQGKLYLTVEKEVKSFHLFINNQKVNTDEIKKGMYEIDYSQIAKNGTNTIQVSEIIPNRLVEAITIAIPYPSIIEGSLEEVGLSEEPFKLLNQIIAADVANGFPSAQLAVIKDGKLVYQNAWGATNDTLYDLASNTKMYAVAYGIQYLINQNQMQLEDKIVDIIGQEFVDNTVEIHFASYQDKYPGIDVIKKWKENLTVKDVLMHQAGFPDSGHYHNEFFDTVNQKLDNEVKNLLYVEDANKEKTLQEGICKTPLIYEPRTKTMYSDIDYMLLGCIIEKITKKDLNTFLSETFWQPMGLEHITYQPLEHGFQKEDCAPTELHGNTRDGLVDFPKVRKEMVQGEVHDEEAYYTMEGVSGHAGIFANATDLAKLASVMLTGGYGNHQFFTKNIRDLFIAPQSSANVNYGIGWWREADDNRVWYFGTQSPESTIGHQGWTGTLTMIDFENHMVIVYLTNTIHTPILDATSLVSANDFAGRYYTTATLGFVPQIIYTGLDSKDTNIKEALDSLIKDMVNEKQKYIEKKEEKNGVPFAEEHPLKMAKRALDGVVKERNQK